MTFLVKRSGWWRETVEIDDESGARLAVIRDAAPRPVAHAGSLVAFIGALLSVYAFRQDALGSPWLALSLLAAVAVVVILQVLARSSFSVTDGQGIPIGSIRGGFLGRPFQVAIGGARYTLTVGENRATLTQDGITRVELAGKLETQTYHIKRGDDYLARVFTHAPEPGYSFLVEMMVEEDPLPIVCMPVMVELFHRPRPGLHQWWRWLDRSD